MVIVTHSSYPPESAEQMAKRFLEAPQAPDFMKRSGPFFTSSTGGGITVLALYELDNASLAEAMNFLGNYMATYFGVPGFRYKVRPYFTVEEGLKMIGM